MFLPTTEMHQVSDLASACMKISKKVFRMLVEVNKIKIPLLYSVIVYTSPGLTSKERVDLSASDLKVISLLFPNLSISTDEPGAIGLSL